MPEAIKSTDASIIVDYTSVLSESFLSLWAGFMAYLPTLLVALIVFLLGWVVAVTVAQAVTRLVSLLRVDQVLEKMGLKVVFDRAGLKLDIAGFVGWLIKWFLILVVLLTSVDILGLDALGLYLREVLGYLPRFIVGILILLVTILVGDILDRLIFASVKAAELRSAELLGKVARWSLYIFGTLAALVQLGIARELLFTLFTGFVAMLAIAGGLAFGFGGKDLAADILEKVRRDISGEK